MSAKPPFLAVPRSALESEWWKDATPLARVLWLTWLSMASREAWTTRKSLRLEAGQLVTSWKDTACRTSWTWKGGRVTPTVGECRAAAALLRIAGEVTWFTSPVATGGGLVVTLERWAFYAGGIEGATDDATGRATTPPVVPTTTEEEKKAPAVRQGIKTKTLTLEERIQAAHLREQEQLRKDREETRRILDEERELRKGVPGGTVH